MEHLFAGTFCPALECPLELNSLNTMSSFVRKHHAKGQLDAILKRHSQKLRSRGQDEIDQNYWRLIRAIQGSSRLLSTSARSECASPKRAEQIVLAFVRMAQHAEQWIRSPEDWPAPVGNSAIQFRSLVNHLFAAYPVPNFVSRLWLKKRVNPWDLPMYFHLAAGKSIRQFDRTLKPILCKKTASYFMLAPDDLSPLAAMSWARLRSLGADPRLARRLVSCTSLADPTRLDAFWDTVIRFLVRHQPLTLDESEQIVRFVFDQKFRPVRYLMDHGHWTSGEGYEPLQPDLCLKRQSIRSLRRNMAHWQTEFASKLGLPEVKQSKGWEPSGIAPLEIHQGDEVWTIEELLSPDELRIEGGIMRHCVAIYRDSCRRKHSSIWSLRVRRGNLKKRLLTIQVIPNTRTICQTKGKSNSSPTQQANEFLKIWATQEGLKIPNF